MKKLVLAGILASLLTGCSGIQSKEQFSSKMDDFVGGSINTMVTSIGSYETKHETPSGYDYVFRNSLEAHGPLSTSGTYCTLNVHADKNGNIVSIDQSGTQQLSFAEEGAECAWAYNNKIK